MQSVTGELASGFSVFAGMAPNMCAATPKADRALAPFYLGRMATVWKNGSETGNPALNAVNGLHPIQGWYQALSRS